MPVKKKVEEIAEVVVEEVVEEKPDTSFDVFLQHQRKAIMEAAKALEEMIPKESVNTAATLFKEVVEGYRKLFNSAMDEIIDTFEKVKFEHEAAEVVAEVKETKAKEVKEPIAQ